MKRILAAMVLTGAAMGAGAQVTFAPPVSGTVFTGVFDAPGLPSFTAGYRNAIISSTAGVLTATFLGKEALDTDTYTFAFASGTLTNLMPANTSSIFGNVGAGPLSFMFADTTTPSTAPNGGGAGFSSYSVLGTFSGPGATGTFTPYTAGGLYQLVLGYNDGLAVDGDYDDMVVGLNVTAIPEPETYALLLAGLGAIGFIARRRQKTFGA